MFSMSELRPTDARFRPVKPALVSLVILMELLMCGVADARHASHHKASEAAEGKANTSEMFLGGNQDWKVEIWKSPSGHRYCQATSQPVTWEKSSFRFEISSSPSISLKLISESPLPKADHVKLAFSDGSTFSLKSSKSTKGSASTVEINPSDDIFTSQADTATRSLTPAKPEAGKSDAFKAQETAPPTAATSSAPANKNGLTTTDPIVVAFLTSGKLPPEPILEPVAEPKVPSTFCKIEDQNEMLSLNKAAQIKANDNYIKAKDYEALLTSLATQANQAGTALANQAGRRWDEYAPTMRLWKATSERLYTQDTIIRSSPVKPCSK